MPAESGFPVPARCPLCVLLDADTINISLPQKELGLRVPLGGSTFEKLQAARHVLLDANAGIETRADQKFRTGITEIRGTIDPLRG